MTPSLKLIKPKLEVADILRKHVQGYQKAYALWPDQHKIISDLLNCRTHKLGGYIQRCNHCGTERVVYHSCRNRHCPKCQHIPRERWLETQKSKLLPTTYFHAVFTLPHALNPIILNNKSVMLNMLFKAVSQSLIKFVQNELGGKLGFVAVLHTWNQQLKAHFHLHCLIAGGAIASDKTRWIPCPKNYLFNQEALSLVFRGKFIHQIARAVRCGKINFKNDWEPFKNKLYTHKWVVSVREPIHHPEHVLEYLARYTYRVAIANSRLLDLKDNQVRFRYKDRKNNQLKQTTISAVEFIRRFLLHTLPKGFFRIRHYGFLANRDHTANLNLIRRLLNRIHHLPKANTSLEQMMLKLTGIDITKCPCCKKGKMHTVAEIPKSGGKHPNNFIRPPNYQTTAAG